MGTMDVASFPESLWLPVILFIVACAGLAVTLLVVGTVVGPQRTSKVKGMPYESGMDPIHDTKRKFDIRFHLVAITFLIFDVELLFLYPWAVASGDPQGIDAVVAADAVPVAQQLIASRALVFGEVMAFIALLALGLVYAWRKGVFQWR